MNRGGNTEKERKQKTDEQKEREMNKNQGVGQVGDF